MEMNFWPMCFIRFLILFFVLIFAEKIFGFNLLINSVPIPETEVGKFWLNLFLEICFCYILSSLWAFKVLIDIEAKMSSIKEIKNNLDFNFDFIKASDKCNENMKVLSEKLKEWKPK
jgi:hypothetical protein